MNDLHALGQKLQEKLPEVNFRLDTESGVFITNDLPLFGKFDNPEQWQDFLEIPNVMPYFDGGIFGLYLTVPQ